jgi:DUF971 family protein
MISPRKVEPDPEKRVLRVLWSDGHRSAIPYQTLRDECPCARCKSQRDAGKKMLTMALTTKLLGWKKLGNYALHFAWGDSHSDGIFAFDFLRGLCPCEGCVAARGATSPEGATDPV